MAEYLSKKVLEQYENGKETATLLCDIADYYSYFFYHSKEYPKLYHKKYLLNTLGGNICNNLYYYDHRHNNDINYNKLFPYYLILLVGMVGFEPT